MSEEKDQRKKQIQRKEYVDRKDVKNDANKERMRRSRTGGRGA